MEETLRYLGAMTDLGAARLGELPVVAGRPVPVKSLVGECVSGIDPLGD